MQLMTQDPEDDADDLAGYCSRAYETLSFLSSNTEAKILFLFVENPG